MRSSYTDEHVHTWIQITGLQSGTEHRQEVVDGERQHVDLEDGQKKKHSESYRRNGNPSRRRVLIKPVFVFI